MKYPKVLVLSIPPWNNTSNTFSDLFSGWDKDALANVYCRDGKPTSDVCDKYFCINEAAVIKSILKRNLKTGCVTERTEETKNLGSGKSPKHSEILSLVRDILWKLGRWNTKELKEFIKDFDPDVILFPIEGYCHFNNIARTVVKLTGKKGIGFLWDDNFTYKPHPSSLSFLLRRFFVRRNVKKTVAVCDKIFAINSKMQKEIKEVFGRDSVIITKGVEQSVTADVRERSFPIRLCYAGKLIIGRDKTLALLSKAIKEVNKEEKKFELSVYTQTALSDEQKNSLNISGDVLKGAVPREELKKIYKETDLLVFAEALSGKDKYAARLSFSTKITDYLSSGKAIFAIAPRDIAPTETLSQNGTAIIAENSDEIVKTLRFIASDPNVLNTHAERSELLSKAEHNITVIREKLYKEISEIEHN